MNPTVTRSLKVFLRHGSEDKPAVIVLYDRRKQDGIDPWLNQKNILGGKKWRPEISKAVQVTARP